MEKIKHISIFTILLSLTFGCSNWQLVQKADYWKLKDKKNHIQIELLNEKRYETSNYFITSDSLFINTSKSPFYEGSKFIIPFDSLSTIKIRQVETKRTILFGFVSIAGFYLLIDTISGLSSSGSGLK